MSKVVLVRVDSRLIHGQVVLKCLKETKAKRILIVDDTICQDPLMVQIFTMAAPEGVQIEAHSSYYGNHWFLYTVLELKGRGITLIETKNSIYKYKVTNRAFDLLKEKYCISQECLLD